MFMLTMEQYDALDNAEKAAAILQGGFLADREENGLIVQLYGVGNFYGESYYDPLANKILRWRAFECSNSWDRTWHISVLIPDCLNLTTGK